MRGRNILIKGRFQMKIIGLLIVVLGAALRWFTSISSAISWVLVIIGIMVVIASYLVKQKNS